MKIFISIASYCDDLLTFTIKDCIKKATNPENIFFGIVDQNDSSQISNISQLPFSKQIRYIYINKLDSQGVCWARNIAFSLFNNEDYLLQVDSHMLFEEDWDSNLIEQYQKLKKVILKPIISTYPYKFSFDDKGEPSYKKPTGKTILVLRPHPEAFLEEDNAVLRFIAFHKFTKTPVHGCHLAGGFIFTSSNFIEEVPYDPFLYFHGEEQSLSVRAFTKGWDIFHPTWIPLYHCYKQPKIEHETHHWYKSVDSKRVLSSSYLKQRAINRINRLLYEDGMKNSVYGLGDVRTLDDYIKFSGIDYKNRTIKNIDSTLK